MVDLLGRYTADEEIICKSSLHFSNYLPSLHPCFSKPIKTFASSDHPSRITFSFSMACLIVLAQFFTVRHVVFMIWNLLLLG